MNKEKLYQRLALVSGLVLIVLGHFAFGWVSFFVPFAKADAVTWVGATTGNWNVPSNWSSGAIPTSADDVIIAGTSPLTVTVPLGTTADFSTLTLDASNVVSGSPVTITGLQLIGNIGTGGSITIRGPGDFLAGTGNIARLQQVNQVPQVISGTLTIESGGSMISGNNGTTTQNYSLDFTASNIDIQHGGIISGYALGFDNGVGDHDGYGPGKGVRGADPNSSGASHAGNGGQDSQGDSGGIGYCDFENPSTLGSGGGGSGAHGASDGSGGSGGSHVSLTAVNTFVFNGVVRNHGVFHSGGGGGGGSIILSADTFSGTPQMFTAAGGNGGGNPNTPLFSGGGGGGCVKVTYGTSISFDPATIIDINGGAAQATNPIYDNVVPVNPPGGAVYQAGGAGTLFVQKQDDSIRKLYVFNTTTPMMQAKLGSETPQSATSHSFQTLTINTSSIYTIGSGKTLTLTDDHPFEGSTSGTIKIEDGGTLKLDTNAILENVIVELHQGGSILDNSTDLSTSLDLTISSGATLDMREFSTTTDPLELHSLTIASGGTITHGSHEGLGNTPTHMVNIRAQDITIESGGSINVSGKGFEGGNISGGDGYGPGGGQHVENEYQSGGGHGAEGGVVNAGGGAAYCTLSNPSTLGSGGAAATVVSSTIKTGFGGDGGGLIWLSASGTLTINGKILAGGNDGTWYNDEDMWPLGGGGGGAGGAIKISAGTVTGTPEQVYIGGGIMGFEGVIDHFSIGGGGCMLVTYTNTSNMTSSSVELSPFGGDPGYSELGLFNSAPVIRNISLKNSDPVFVSSVASTTAMNNPFEVVVQGNYAYVGWVSGAGGLAIIDISNKFNPVIVGKVTSSTTGSKLAVAGNYAYVTSNGGDSFQIVDISNSASPTLKGSIVSSTVLDGASGIDVSGNYAYVSASNDDSVRIIDISNPNTPVIVGGVKDSVNLDGANGIRVSGNYAYITAAGNNSLRIVDISNPTNPVIVGGVKDDTALLSVAHVRVVGSYAYVVSGLQDKFKIINISDPLHPYIAGGIDTVAGLDNPGIPFILGNYAYVPTQNTNSLYVIDISSSTNPVIIHTFTSSTLLSGARGVYASGDYVYVASQNSKNLSIFDVSGASVSFEAEDMDNDTLSVRAEYAYGSDCSYAGGSYLSFSTSTVNTTSSYGNATINNAAGDNRHIQNISTLNTRNTVTSTWRTFIDLPSTEGNYCVFLSSYDGVSESGESGSSLAIDYASVTPSVPVFSSFSSTQSSITARWDAIPGATAYILSTSATSSPIETMEAFYTFDGLLTATSYSFQIKSKDSFGNESSYSSVISQLTSSAPGSSPPAPPSPPSPDPACNPAVQTCATTGDNPSGLILINNGSVYTNSRTVTIFLNTSFVTSYILSDSPDFSGKSYIPATPAASYVLPSGDGVKKVYARFSNTYGIYDAYDEIVLDTLAPPTPFVLPLSSNELIQNVNGKYTRSNVSSSIPVRPTLAGTAEPRTKIIITLSSGVVASAVHLAGVEIFETDVDGAGNWSFTFPSDLENTTYLVSVVAQDEAGNASNPDNMSLDLTTVSTPPACSGSSCEPPLCTTDCAPIEEPPVLPPCTTNCEPITPPTEPPCTTDCGGEPVTTPPDTTGDGGENTNTQNTSANGSSTETPNTTETEQTPTQQVISTITDSARVITDTVTTFFTEVGDAIQQIPGVASVTKVAGIAIEKTKEVINNPEVEQANETIAAPVIAAVAVVNVAAGGVPLLAQVMTYIRLIFSQPLLLLKRRKQKKWGVVFNAYTKQPLDLATVRLTHADTNTIQRTQVTDAKGRYFMVAGAGTYQIQTTKEGFQTDASHMNEDSVYSHIYHGEKVSLTDETNEVSYNIPLKPVIEEKSSFHILKEYSRISSQKTVGLIGALATIVSLIISPNIWIITLLIVHIILYTIIKRLAHKKIKGTYGTVSDNNTKRPVAKSVIRVFDAMYNKLVETTVTDSKGRYAVLVGPSTYYVTVEKEGYTTAQSGIVDLSSEKTNGVGGVIAEPISLVKPGMSPANSKNNNIHMHTMPSV